MVNETWDKRFLSLAQHIANWSKDPSTKVGAVIVDQNRRIVSTGYNGYPKGVDDTIDTDEREIKYKKVIHAEKNAILFAKQDLTGCTLYVTHHPCSQCAGYILQAGISRVVTLSNIEFDLRHKHDQKIANALLTSVEILVD